MPYSSIILNTDSYKSSHFLQYPQGTTTISSYIEPRGGKYKKGVFFGLQAFLKEYLTKPITPTDVIEAREIFSAHGVPFNSEGWLHIINKHGGYLPLHIQAVEEGTVLPVKNVIVQVKNTDSNCFWLTNYIETALLRAIWYPMTVASLSWHLKQTIRKFLAETADNTDGLLFKLHDFGARGASSEQSSALGGMGHLINFLGSDTISAIVAARKFYNAEMPAFSIPAAEHSTITSWKRENEEKAYANMLELFLSRGKAVAVVSDSYNLWNAIDKIWGETLKEKIKESAGTLIIRPDSGDPIEVATTVIEKLMVKFGYIINSKGYRVLPSYIRVIQGDGVSSQKIKDILIAMKSKGQSADNISFGMGGELLQKLNRDTMQFAMKASAVKVNGTWRDIHKTPITDPKKTSRSGRLALIFKDRKYQTIRESTLKDHANILQPVFHNGELLKEIDFEQVRKNSNLGEMNNYLS